VAAKAKESLTLVFRFGERIDRHLEHVVQEVFRDPILAGASVP
jgi:hypothetical protein